MEPLAEGAGRPGGKCNGLEPEDLPACGGRSRGSAGDPGPGRSARFGRDGADGQHPQRSRPGDRQERHALLVRHSLRSAPGWRPALACAPAGGVVEDPHRRQQDRRPLPPDRAGKPVPRPGRERRLPLPRRPCAGGQGPLPGHGLDPRRCLHHRRRLDLCGSWPPRFPGRDRCRHPLPARGHGLPGPPRPARFQRLGRRLRDHGSAGRPEMGARQHLPVRRRRPQCDYLWRVRRRVQRPHPPRLPPLQGFVRQGHHPERRLRRRRTADPGPDGGEERPGPQGRLFRPGPRRRVQGRGHDGGLPAQPARRPGARKADDRLRQCGWQPRPFGRRQGASQDHPVDLRGRREPPRSGDQRLQRGREPALPGPERAGCPVHGQAPQFRPGRPVFPHDPGGLCRRREGR